MSGRAGTSRNIASHVSAARRSCRTLLSTLVSLSLFLWPQFALAQDPADTLCLNALYRVVYRDSVTNGRALTDDFEKEYSLFSQARLVRGGTQELGFVAVFPPNVAHILRQQPHVLLVERKSHWCERVTKPSYPSTLTGPPDSVPRTQVQLLALPPEATFQFRHSDLDSLRAVVREPDDWKALWAAETPLYPVPTIDFEREMLLVAAAGVRYGTSIRIDSVFVAQDTMFAVVREHSGCVGLPMSIRPFHVVRVAQTGHPVMFIDRGMKRRPCP